MAEGVDDEDRDKEIVKLLHDIRRKVAETRAVVRDILAAPTIAELLERDEKGASKGGADDFR